MHIWYPPCIQKLAQSTNCQYGAGSRIEAGGNPVNEIPLTRKVTSNSPLTDPDISDLVFVKKISRVIPVIS